MSKRSSRPIREGRHLCTNVAEIAREARAIDGGNRIGDGWGEVMVFCCSITFSCRDFADRPVNGIPRAGGARRLKLFSVTSGGAVSTSDPRNHPSVARGGLARWPPPSRAGDHKWFSKWLGRCVTGSPINLTPSPPPSTTPGAPLPPPRAPRTPPARPPRSGVRRALAWYPEPGAGPPGAHPCRWPTPKPW